MALAALAVMRGDGFALQLQQFCTKVLAAYYQMPWLTRGLGDLGSFFTLAVLVAKQEGGVTLADVRRVVCSRLASVGRVRAIIAELERTQLLTRVQARDDARRHHLVLGGGIASALAVWGNAYLAAIGWAPLEKTSQAALCAMRFLAQTANAYEKFGFLLADGYPVVLTLYDRFGGHPMLLGMIGTAIPLPDGTAVTLLSRRKVASLLGLTRANLTIILAQCESRGWLLREAGTSRLILSGAMYCELRTWIAREIAWTRASMGPAQD